MQQSQNESQRSRQEELGQFLTAGFTALIFGPLHLQSRVCRRKAGHKRMMPQ